MILEIIKSAVYILILEGVVVYVGESASAYSRIGSHVKDVNKRFDTVRVLRCAEHRRKYWEAVLIDKYQPLFNKKGKNKETAKRHIYKLSKIKKGQEERPVSCKNCEAQHSIYNATPYPFNNTTLHSLDCGFGASPLTTACSSAGTITLETIPASNEVFAKLAHEEKNYKKKEAWDNSVGYTEKIHESLDIGFKTSNRYISTSITDPDSLKKLLV